MASCEMSAFFQVIASLKVDFELGGGKVDPTLIACNCATCTRSLPGQVPLEPVPSQP